MGILSKISEFARRRALPEETPFNINNFNIDTLTKELHLTIFDNILTVPETGSERVAEILKDIDVSAMVNKINRAVSSNTLTVWSDNEENLSLVNAINSRFYQVKFNRVIEYILSQRYYGFSCFEMIYNPDFTLQTLLFIPQKFITYDRTEKVWMIRSLRQNIEITHDKYLLNIHKYNPEYKMGISLFDSVNECFTDKVKFRRQLRNISDKYGDTIIIFAYDPRSDLKKVREQAAEIKKMRGKDVVAVPVNLSIGDGKSVPLTNYMHILSLNELEPKIYAELERIEKEKILQNLLGGTLTMEAGNGSGSYALGEVHEQGFEQVIEECRELVTDSLYKLIEIDAHFFGYDPKEFYFKLEPPRNLKEEAELQQKQENVRSSQLDNIMKLKENIGYTLPTEYISNIFELKESDLTAYEAPQVQTPFVEFAKKKNNLLDIRSEQWMKYVNEFTKTMYKDIKKWLKNPLGNELELDFSKFENMYLKTYLLGRIDVSSKREFADEDPFDIYNMTNERALNWALAKNPALYETIEKTLSEVNDTTFWIKRSTELEATIKVNEAIIKAIEQGSTYKDFMKDIESVAEKAGLSEDGWYSRLVYNQNMANAYAAADYEEHLEMIDDFPYWKYIGVADDRQSEICRNYDGRIYKATDPIWSIMYPPNHFQCRSTVIPLSKEEVEGQKIWKSKGEELKALKKEAGTFSGTPTMKKQMKTLEKNIELKEEKIKELSDKITSSMEKIKELTPEEENAIFRYIGGESYTLNNTLRLGEELSEDLKEWAKLLDKALDKMPKYDGVVTRSLDFSHSSEDLAEFIKSYTVGSKIEYSQYLSTTNGDTYNPDGEVQIRILSKTGRDITNMNTVESEILFQRGAEFVVKQFIYSDIYKKYLIVLEES